MKRKEILIMSALIIAMAVALIVIRSVDKGSADPEEYYTPEQTSYGPEVNEKEEGWTDLGDWEINFDDVPNFEMLDQSMSWIELHSMVGRVIQIEGWTDLHISVNMSSDCVRSDDGSMFTITLHGDVNNTVVIDKTNFTYMIQS